MGFIEEIQKAGEKNRVKIEQLLSKRTQLVNDAWFVALTEDEAIDDATRARLMKKAERYVQESVIAQAREAEVRKLRIVALVTGQLSLNESLDFIKQQVPAEARNLPLRSLIDLLASQD